MEAEETHPTGGLHDLLRRATFALRNQHPQEAERIANEAIKSDIHNVQAKRIFSYALLAQGRAHDVIATLEPAAQNVCDSEIDTLLALALRQVGRETDAISRLNHAIERHPPFPLAFYELSALLASGKRYGEAIEVLNKGLVIAPTMLEMAVQLGFVSIEVKDFNRAKAAFAKALAISAGSPHAMLGMGRAEQALGEHRSAIELFRRCLLQAPNDAGVLLYLADSLLEVGERDAGYDCLRAVARRDGRRYFQSLSTLSKSSRGRFWLKPSEAKSFLLKEGRQPGN